MSDTPLNLAERLVLARSLTPLSQEDVARAIGIAQPSYSELERGLSKRTTKIGSLAQTLGVDAYWLETGKGAMKPTTGVADSRAEYMTADRRRLLEIIDDMTDRRRKALLQLLDN